MQYLTEYDLDWSEWFREIQQYLKPHLPASVRVEHVGSTSVGGMPAKPIIDIDIVVADGQMTEAIAAIVQAGYVHQGDLGIAGREAFQAADDVTRSLPPHHLYACEASSPELRKHVSFREYLRTHPHEARRLAEFKRDLVFRQALSRSEYIEAKSPLVGEIAALALDWYRTDCDHSAIDFSRTI